MQYVGFVALSALFVFFTTALGAAFIYIFKRAESGKMGAFFLGTASGIMLASSIWSLLLPSIEQAQVNWGKLSFIPAVLGVLLGGGVLLLLEQFAVYRAKKENNSLFFSVTLHNIPEGLAVGFALGMAHVIGTTEAYVAAFGLAVGVGLQNIPEGFAVALPIYLQTSNKKRAFSYGVCSGLPEPFCVILGAILSAKLRLFQPWLLAFAAGAMIFVVVKELIPESQERYKNHGSVGALVGFVVMMALDVALG